MNKTGRHNGKHTPTHEKRTRKEQKQPHIDKNNNKTNTYIEKTKKEQHEPNKKKQKTTERTLNGQEEVQDRDKSKIVTAMGILCV